MPRIAARYIGTSPVALAPRPGDPYLDANGTPLESRPSPINGNKALYIANGESLMAEEQEVLGQTWLCDAHNNNQPIFLGNGYYPLPQHAGMQWWDLSSERFQYDGTTPSVNAPTGMYYYEFHEGRRDFTPFTPNAHTFALYPTPETPAPVVQTVVLPEPTPETPLAPSSATTEDDEAALDNTETE